MAKKPALRDTAAPAKAERLENPTGNFTAFADRSFSELDDLLIRSADENGDWVASPENQKSEPDSFAYFQQLFQQAFAIDFDAHTFCKNLERSISDLRLYVRNQISEILFSKEKKSIDINEIENDFLSNLDAVRNLVDTCKTPKIRNKSPQTIVFVDGMLDNYIKKWQDEKLFIYLAIGHLTDENRNAESLSAVQRLERLRQFAEKHGDEGLEAVARTLFPEWSFAAQNQFRTSVIADRLALPTEAPERYQGLRGPETPPQFIKRVYGEWLGKGLDRPTVRRLDPALGQALDNWLRKNDMPPDVDLPTAKERNAREIEQLRAASRTGDIKDVVGSFTLREARRIEANIRRHEQMTTNGEAATPLSDAPALWKNDKLAGDTPPEFIKRVYGKWLGKGLDRPTVRRLDPSLGQALDNWLQRNDMPPDLDLPTAKERSAREISALKELAKDSSLHRVLGSFTAREASRIRSNIARHEGRKK